MKKIIIGSGIVLIIAALIMFNMLKEAEGIEVTVEKVERGFVQQRVTGSGRISPAVDVNVSAQVAGKIVTVNAEEGDRVSKGQLLVALDPTQYQANMERARSSLLSAQANEKKAMSDLKRTRELFAKKLISPAELESAVANYEIAKSNRLQAEAALREAEDALNKTKLYATMNGIVTEVNKEEGEMAIGAQFQEDVIMVISDLSVMEAVIEVDENDVVNISEGDSAEVEVDAFPDTLYRGVVTEIAHSAITRGLGTQEQVTNFEVTITLETPDRRFRPGMSTTVDILTKRLDNILKVPIQSVTVRDKKKLERKKDIEEHETETASDAETEEEVVEVVFVVKDNKAIARPVEKGISDDTHYAVLSGLDEGEQVVTGPFKTLSKTLESGDLVETKSKKEE